MLSVALLSLLVPTTATASLPATAALTQQDNLPVTIWLNKRNVQLGDRVRAYARTNADGYLVVLHAEPDGRVRVLFPVDPGQDNFVRAGSDYEIHGRGSREAFRVYSSNGIGTVYAAFSRDPFVFEPFSRADHWDYGLPETWIVIEDAEAELTDIAVTMASGAYFDYDYVQYGAGESVAPAPGAVSLSFYGGTYVGLGLGAYYYPDYYSWRRWALLSYPYYYGYPYYGSGWYDPFYYGYYPYWGWAGYYGWNGWRWPYYWRDRYWYGWGSHYYGGYGGWYYSYSNGHGYSTYSNGRIRYTPPRSPYNATSRTRRVYTAGHTTSPARRVALANGGTANSRGTSSAGRRTSGTVVRVADTPTRRTASTAIRNAGTSTRRSFPQQPVRTTPVRTSTPDTRSVAAAGRRESSVAPSSTRTTGSVTGQSRPVTTRRTTAPTRPQVSPVRTTDVRRQVTSTRRTTTPSVNRSTTIRRPTSSVRPTTSRPSTSTPRQVTSAPRTRTTATVRRPSTPTRTPTRVSRPAAPRSTGSVSRTSSGSTSRSTASKPTRRKKP